MTRSRRNLTNWTRSVKKWLIFLKPSKRSNLSSGKIQKRCLVICFKSRAKWMPGRKLSKRTLIITRPESKTWKSNFSKATLWRGTLTHCVHRMNCWRRIGKSFQSQMPPGVCTTHWEKRSTMHEVLSEQNFTYKMELKAVSRNNKRAKLIELCRCPSWKELEMYLLWVLAHKNHQMRNEEGMWKDHHNISTWSHIWLWWIQYQRCQYIARRSTNLRTKASSRTYHQFRHILY